MTPEQLAETEKLVNEAIARDLPVVCEEMDVDSARAKGAMGLFGSKYGQIVKVYTMGDVSCEICGGPHAASFPRRRLRRLPKAGPAMSLTNPVRWV